MIRDVTPPQLVAPIRAASTALAPHVGSAVDAEEIVRNAAQCVLYGEPVFSTILDLIEHRVRHGWVRCADVARAALDATQAWETEEWLS